VGPQGGLGPQGVAGVDGPQGVTGLQGVTGNTGCTGPFASCAYNSSHWESQVPDDICEAINRIAAFIYANNGSIPT
jgi:hypothetical protein